MGFSDQTVDRVIAFLDTMADVNAAEARAQRKSELRLAPPATQGEAAGGNLDPVDPSPSIEILAS
jgi:hypothetical protein